MYIKIILSYILGFLRISVEGYFIERFINLCVSKNILLWKTNREKSTFLKANITIRDFKKIAPIAKKTKCKIKIETKKGLPFIFNKYKKRKIFFVFLFLIVIAIIALSNFVWNIQVEGNSKIPTEEIIATLKQEGLDIGKLKGSIDTKQIVDKMRLDRNDLAWIGIELKGTNAHVRVVEADLKPEIIKEDEYCNIIATKPGIIVKVNAVNGTPVVKEGDVINEGSILIAGWLEGKYTGTRYVHANGIVQAKVWYSQTEKVELKELKNVRTEKLENKYSVKLNNFQINFYKTLSKFEKYDTIIQNKKLKLFSDFYLPIEIIKITNYELEQKQEEHTKEEAKNIAVERAKEVLDKQVENKENILNTYINYKETDNEVEAQVIYEVLEDIGTKDKIVF